MRPVLKSYVGFGTSDNGVFFEAGERSFELKDPKLFPLVSRLLRMLDGSRTTQAILDMLPEHLRPLFRTLMSELDRNAMLQLVSSDYAPAIPAEVAARYRTTLAFLQDESASGRAHFLTWRTQPLVVGGAGHSHRALLRGLIGSGAGNLLLVGEVSEPVEDLLPGHEDSGFSLRRIGALDEAPADARFLYAADDLSEPLAGEAMLGHPTVLAGGVYRGRGLVGPRGGTSAWSTLKPVEAPLPFPASTLGVIGALLAFEALKALLYGEKTTPGEASWDETHLFTITAAADIAVHPVGTDAPRAPAPVPAQAAAPPVDAAVDASLERPFDRVTGPFTWQEPGGREYPLPRRAILIRHPDGREKRVSQWALTPQQLDLRTVCKAAATLAGGDAHAAPDYDSWLHLARADATVRSGRFERAASFDIDPIGETDPALQMLIRLTRLYSDAMPRLRIAHLPGAPAFLAEAIVGGVVGRAAHGAAVPALVEALGEAISTHQQAADEPPSSRYRPLAEPAGPARRVSELPSGPDQPFAFAPEILSPAYLTGTGIVLGRMVLERVR